MKTYLNTKTDSWSLTIPFNRQGTKNWPNIIQKELEEISWLVDEQSKGSLGWCEMLTK